MTAAAIRVAVCSRSFSKNAVLRAELLARYSTVTFNDRGASLEGDALVEFLRGHDRAIVALERITSAVLDQLPELRVISKYGVGLDGLDTAALAARGVRLGWTAGVNRRSVAEVALAFAISLVHGLDRGGRQVRAGTWQQIVGRQLTGRTVGIVGFGHVGAEVATLLQPLACTLLAHDLVERPAAAALGVSYVGLDELLTRSELVTVHLPLDASTHGLLSRVRLAQMAPGAWLVNTARGGIVDEDAVRDMLTDGRLGGAAFDVFASEPPSDRALLEHPAFIVTPHLGGSALEAVIAMGRAAIAGLDEPAAVTP